MRRLRAREVVKDMPMGPVRRESDHEQTGEDMILGQKVCWGC
jgi:hypothetical protein